MCQCLWIRWFKDRFTLFLLLFMIFTHELDSGDVIIAAWNGLVPVSAMPLFEAIFIDYIPKNKPQIVSLIYTFSVKTGIRNQLFVLKSSPPRRVNAVALLGFFSLYQCSKHGRAILKILWLSVYTNFCTGWCQICVYNMWLAWGP